MSDPVLKIGESGLNTSEEKIKSLMTKMVNSETPGFKGSEVLVRSFPLELEAAEKRVQSMVPKVEGTFYNQLQGALISTGNPTHVALGSKGFFVLVGSWGEGYTRDGRFKLDSSGHLLSSVGDYPLMGQKGPIEIPAGSKVEITSDGDVKAEGILIDRIRVVDFEESDLRNLVSLNGSIFKAAGDGVVVKETETPRLVQGYVEASNVNMMEEMRDLVILQREATGHTEIIKNRDAALSRLLTIGKTTQ